MIVFNWQVERSGDGKKDLGLDPLKVSASAWSAEHGREQEAEGRGDKGPQGGGGL